MTNKTYTAKIKLPSGVQEVVVQATGYFMAKEMLEAQYGRGSIFWGPVAAN